MLPPHIQRRSDNIAAAARRATDAAEVFEAASVRLRDMIPFDAAMWHPTDPATGLPSAAPRLDGIFDSRACVPYWELEFLADDVNQFHDLARSPVPVGTLRTSTGDRQMRSPRFRQFLATHVGDELRAVLRVDDRPWGAVTVLRNADRSPFSERDVAIVADLSRPLAMALRPARRACATEETQSRPPRS